MCLERVLDQKRGKQTISEKEKQNQRGKIHSSKQKGKRGKEKKTAPSESEMETLESRRVGSQVKHK